MPGAVDRAAPQQGKLTYPLLSLSPGTTTSFALDEFRCKCGCRLVRVPLEFLFFLQHLQNLRDYFNPDEFVRKPCTIVSGFRCATHNTNVGGAEDSAHLRGLAADITIKGITPAEVAIVAASKPEFFGPGGVGLYPTFTHVDVMYWGKLRRWGTPSGWWM